MFLQKIRLKFANLYFVLPFCCLFFYVTTEATASQTHAVEFSGQELFEGIFFANGSVAESIPELQGLNARSLAVDRAALNEVIDYQNSLMARVTKENPRYFTELEKAVQGRNPVVVKSTIEKGAEILKGLTEADGYKASDADQAKMESLFQSYKDGKISSSELATSVKAYSKANAALTPVAAVAIYFVILVWVLLWIPVMDPGSGSELYTERMVDSLIKL